MTNKIYEDVSLRETRAIWLKGPKRFAFRDKYGEAIFNSFFDILPQHNYLTKTVNIVPVTQKKSTFRYGYDLVSGKKFGRYEYCSQYDLGDKYNSEISRPNFTIGIIPRVLDQIGGPQRIIVFGKKSLGRSSYTRARVIGSFIEQSCRHYPCIYKEDWLSTMVLVGIFEKDKKLKDIHTIEMLKKKINWPYVKAFWENSNGNFKMGDDSLGAYRIKGYVTTNTSFESILLKKKFFTSKKLIEMRKACYGLYDYMWNSAELIRAYKNKDPSFLMIQKRVVAFNKSSSKEVERSFIHFFSIFLFSIWESIFNLLTLCTFEQYK